MKNSSVWSGTDVRNSDIGDLADFSSDEEESQVEQISGCPIPGCQCEGSIEYMEWDYDDLSDSEDSEWEDPGHRSIRESVERYNLDLFEGMTPMTYTPPPRKNRRKGYENNVKYTPEELPQPEPALQLTTDAEEDISSCRDKKENYGPPMRAESDCGEYSECFDRPVTESVMARAADTEVILVMNVSTVATEQSELRTLVLCKTDKQNIPVNGAELTPERQRPENILPGALRQVKMRNNQWNCVDYCFGMCGKADSVNRPETCSSWNCCCLIIWGYRVSCLAAIVIEGRSYGIDLFTEDRRVFTRGLGLVGNPVTPCDVMRVHTKMKENIKGGKNNFMIRSNDPVDSHHLQRCADNGRRSLAHAPVRGEPIREKGRFRCVDTSVRDADWSVVFPVGLSPVGDIRIDYLRDGAPLTELLVFYTLLHLYNYCAAGSALSWTFCDTVGKNSGVKELSLRCSVFPVCQMMEGAALVDDCSGVTFDVELCIPWDAPEAVVDLNSAEVVTLGSLPDKVGLFGRRKDAAVSRILQGRDSRSVRFLVPDARGLDQNFHDVTIVDMDDEREPMVTPADMKRLRDLWPPEIFNHMKWFQQDLDLMRKSAKREFSQERPMPCRFCGKVIRVNLYRHVARLHLDLVQLWRCPIAWCTTWKGSPQDCLEHLRNGHDVPWISKTASIEKYAPPWTVRRALWTESLRVEHSGISTDILLFSELGLSLTQHYRVYRGGLPHAVFRTDYIERLRALLPPPRRLEVKTASPPETRRGATPRSARRLHRSSRPNVGGG